MPVVAVVHRNVALRASLKRGISRPHVRVVACRTLRRVEKLIDTEVVDGIVADIRLSPPEWMYDVRRSFPTVPLFVMSPFRPDDGNTVRDCYDNGIAHLLVEDVDAPCAGELVRTRLASSIRARELSEAPRLLRLSEPLQRKAWQEVLGRVGMKTSTSDIADALGISREHLSREFGAGGAPNLKRVIDLARLVCAAEMLRNPGYRVGTVASILCFASSSHLANSARRLAGTNPGSLAGLGPRGVLRRFLDGRTRSRI